MKSTIELTATEVQKAIRFYINGIYDIAIPESGNCKVIFFGTLVSQPSPTDSIITLADVSATVVYTS